MKNPIAQMVISFVVALVVALVLLAILGPSAEYSDDGHYTMWVVLILAVGLGIYFGCMFLLSRTPEEIEAEVTKLESAEYFQNIARQSAEIKRLAKAGPLPATVKRSIDAVLLSSDNVLKDLRTKPDQTRLYEFTTDLTDFRETFEGYVGILTGDISFDSAAEKDGELKAFEDSLPQFVSGFKSYETEVDQSKRILATAKRNLLQNRMRSRGRINE